MFKPYQIVLVTHADYSHYGEVISRKTDVGTYMVRMIPGDPRTMRECPEEMLSMPHGLGKKKKLWVHYAEVSGNFSFPIDMLRYDHAAPVNFIIEWDEMGRIKTVPIDNEFHEKDKLIIAKLTYSKKPSWTDARWASFSWQIKYLKSLPHERS